jgi:hypothetical protein
MTAIADLRARLEGARDALLDAVRTLSERDFAAPLGDATIVDALAALAREEREAIRAAREAVGAEPRPLPRGQATGSRPLPPQVVHDLAGARYETTLLLDWLGATEIPQAATAAAEALLRGIEARETDIAAQITGRSGGSAHPA